MKNAFLTLELTAFAALIVISIPVPDFVLLLSLASVSIWVRGRSWLDVGFRVEAFLWQDVILGLALGTGIQLLLWRAFGSSLDLNVNPVVRGNLQILVIALSISWVGGALTSEMVFRGYLLERVRGLVGEPYGTVVAVAVAAVAFGVYAADGSSQQFIGATIAGLGYGWLYLARGNLVLPIAMHGAFEATPLILTYLKLT